MKREIIAKTFTPIYDEIEDRLRFVVNYQDIHNRVDFMITRNFIINLISTAEEFIAKHYTLDAPQISIESSSSSNNKESNLSQTDGTNLELLKTAEELLLEVNFTFISASKRTILSFESKNIRAKSEFDGAMLTQVFSVLKSAMPFVKWGISFKF